MVVIDSHCHCGRIYGKNFSSEHLINWADKCGFDRVFVSHMSAIRYDFHEGANREVAEMVKQFPDRIIGYVAIGSPYHGNDALDELAMGVEDYGMRGLKIYSSIRGGFGTAATLYSIDNPAILPLIQKAAHYKIPILAHATPEECEAVSRLVPDAILIMAHAGGQPVSLGDWNRAIESAKKYSNILLDTTSSLADMGYLEAIVAAIGAERLLFGTDMPLLDPHVQVAKVKYAGLTQSQKELILGGNMARILGMRA